MRECVTITVGTVIGVGLFTVGANAVGTLGSWIFWATLVALLISIYPALLYAEMGAALPFAGGTYKYATYGLGKPLGMLAGWNFIIAIVAVTSGEAMAFSFYFKTLFEALHISVPVSEEIIAYLVIGLFILINWKGIEITGKLQNGFIFFFWGVAIVWILSMLSQMNIVNCNPFVMQPSIDFKAFIGAVAVVWWCFAGFETCCAMGEEIKYPQINIPRALFLSPFIVFIVNALFQWVLLGIVPTGNLEVISVAAAPYTEAMKTAGIVGFPLVLLAAGITFGGDFSTLNATIAAPPRYLFSMARDGVVPKVFAKIHPKYQTPYVAIIVLGGLSILLISTGSIVYIASLSLFADLFYYVLGIAAAMGLRKKKPNLVRPYRAPFIKIGAPVSIVIYLFMMTQLEKSAILFGVIWCIIGMILYKVCTRKQGLGEVDEWEELERMKEVMMPTSEEQKVLDREYKIWKCVVIVLTVGVCLLYGIAYLRY